MTIKAGNTYFKSQEESLVGLEFGGHKQQYYDLKTGRLRSVPDAPNRVTGIKKLEQKYNTRKEYK